MLPKPVEDLIEQLADERLAGATGCVRQALAAAHVLAECAAADEWTKQRLEFAQRLKDAKPDMAGLLAIAEQFERAETAAKLATLATKLKERMEDAVDQVVMHALETVIPGATVGTISCSGTVVQALKKAHEMVGIQVVVTESRPLCEGKELACALSAQDVPTLLGVDGAALSLLGRCDVIWVGADTLGDDFFVNKIGTWALALGAREFGIPLFVLCDSLKRLPAGRIYQGGGEQPVEEVIESPPKGLTIANPYFEAIPLSLVTGVIDEQGLVSRTEFMLG